MFLSDALCVCVYGHYSDKMHIHNSLFGADCGSILECFTQVNTFFLYIHFEKGKVFLCGGIVDGKYKM